MKKSITAVLAIVAVLALIVGGCQSQSVGTGTNLPATTTVSCPSDGTSDGQVKYEDKLASTTTFDATPTVYFVSNDGADVTAGSLSASAWSTSADLTCGTKYTPIAVTTKDTMASAVGQEFVASGPATQKLLQGHKIAGLSVKVKDMVSDNYMNVTSKNDADGSFSAFVGVGANDNHATNVSDYPGQSSLTVGADGYIDIRFDTKTNVTKSRFGESTLKTYLCVDADSTKWAEPVVSLGSTGVALSDVMSSLNSNDQNALNGYEYCYEVGQIADIPKSINVYMETASGVNPSSSDKPVFRFVAEGKYVSQKDKDAQGDAKINIGAFQDDTSRTEVFSGQQSTLELNVA